MNLEWEASESRRHHHAQTPFGTYAVIEHDQTGWGWEYCFVEYFDEDKSECADLDEGKRLANEHWQERIAPIIAPYTAGKSDVVNEADSEELRREHYRLEQQFFHQG